MNKVFWSLIIVVATIATALFLQASQAGTSVALTPTELLQRAENGASLKRVRLGGKVTNAIPVHYQTEPSVELTFGVESPGTGGGTPVSVIYRGLKPDMFSAGRDVILDGEFKDGVFVAASLLTQCPSKYEPPSPSKTEDTVSHAAQPSASESPS